MHHDPRFYSDPEKFDPDRWAGNSGASRPRLAYAPFSAGPRQCIGEGYAWMEGVLVMATLAQQWQLSLVPGQRVEMQPLLTLRPRYGLPMTLNQRTGQAA